MTKVAKFTKATLKRVPLTESRELEYFSESELTTQTGYPKELWWPSVVAKELIDNALDACEEAEADVASVIELQFDGSKLCVSDNGNGIPADVIARTLDYSVRTSTKRAYVSPTRGAQGNALKTVLAIPYVLSGGKPATVEIITQGKDDLSSTRHTIAVSTDAVAQKPITSHKTSEIVKTVGTSVRLALDSTCSQDHAQRDEWVQDLQKLIRDYALFNPHATFILNGERFEATDPEWQKWLPSDPTPAHWYDRERLAGMIRAFISAEQNGEIKPRTVRELVSDFRGLSGTAKQTQVCESAGLSRTYLYDMIDGNDVDRDKVERLLAAMKMASTPVKPDKLGVLGNDHFAKLLAGTSFQYAYREGFDNADLPWVLEVAFAYVGEDSAMKGIHIGLNFSVPLTQPLQQAEFADYTYGLSGLLEHYRIDIGSDPVCLAVHITHPRFTFLDRGKGSLSLSDSLLAELSQAVLKVTKKWIAVKKAKDKERDAEANRRERAMKAESRSRNVMVKEAAYEIMPEAYEKAAGRVGVANARQVMYAARPHILERIADNDRRTELSDSYFTQTLLPEYQRDYPDETKDWDVAYDVRGHLIEPHTDTMIGLGTLGVRDYLEKSDSDTEFSIQPKFDRLFPTYGPNNRYGALLYIEKEGFSEILAAAKLGERYDLAIMSAKGLATTAARDLIAAFSGRIKIFCVHDFDRSGFSIAGILTRDTARYQFKSTPDIIDLGLRLKDVEEYDLQSEREPFLKKNEKDSARAMETIDKNGATPEEIEFLTEGWEKGERSGQRVELNAFTSDQLIEWLEGKLEQHGVKKLIPDEHVLEMAWRRNKAIKLFEDYAPEVEKKISALKVPTGLKRKVARHLKANPDQPWESMFASTQAVSHQRQG